jgi:hypothetical protein
MHVSSPCTYIVLLDTAFIFYTTELNPNMMDV